ncbi:MAG: glycosyltransferase [Smithellaceae bacterium]
MHILTVTNLYPNPIEPSRGIFTHRICQQLLKTHRIDVLTPIPWYPKVKLARRFRKWHQLNMIPGSYSIDGIGVSTVRYPYIPKLGSFFHPWLMFPSLYQHIRRLFQFNHYDCIFASWIFPDGVAAAKVGRLLNVPVALNAVGCDINLYSHSWILRWQIQRAFLESDTVITVSTDLSQRLIALGLPPGKVVHVPNGVDLEMFQLRDRSSARKKLSLETDQPLILFVGSLEEVKGIPYFLEAILHLRHRRGKSFRVVMLGDGSWKGRILDFISQHALKEIVELVGPVLHGHVPLYMNAADILCLPSIREGHPNVINEALASGVPIVGSRVGAIPQLVNSEAGIVVEPGDSAALANGLLRALDSSWDAMTIRATVRNNSWEECAQKYSLALESIVSSAQIRSYDAE